MTFVTSVTSEFLFAHRGEVAALALTSEAIVDRFPRKSYLNARLGPRTVGRWKRKPIRCQWKDPMQSGENRPIVNEQRDCRSLQGCDTICAELCLSPHAATF
jgi:hypothetical protein